MSTLPHLVYLSTVDPTQNATGTTTRAKLFVRQLTNHFAIHVICFSRPELGASDPEILRGLASYNPVPYSHLGYFLFSPKLHRTAARVIEEVQPRALFADFEKAGLYARLLTKKRRIAYFYNSHDIEYQRYVDLARGQPLRYALVPWMYFAERLGCAGAATTIAISNDDAAVFRRWVGNDRVITKPAAFDEKMFNPFGATEATSRPILLMVGNFGYSANVAGARALVEKVIPAVVARHPDVVFRFVGRQFPKDLTHPNLESTGFVEDLAAEYRRAAVVLVPIEMGGGIKIKLVEALACGCSVVATPKAMEGIEDSGFESLRVGEIDQFPDLIGDFLQSVERRTTLNWVAVCAQFGGVSQVNEIAAMISRISFMV